jgi:HK97 family phage major capsid protein
VPYTNVISRTDVQALIPETVSNEMLTNLADQSAALALMRRIPISTNQTRFPVLAALPTAYFVNGDTGLKQTTEVNWDNKYLNVEELAAIVPIPESVLDDTSFDVWGSVRPLLEQAIGRALDAAVFFGTNKPASWPDAIVPAAVAAGNTAVRGTSTQAQGGIAQDINLLMGTVESDGFDVNGFVTARTFRSVLRGARASDGQKLLDVSNDNVEGVRVVYAMPGLWPTAVSTARMIAGDWTQAILGVRQDFTYKILDQAVITDGGSPPVIQYNLAQQDMVALRVVFRVAYQVANTLNYQQAVEADRFPFGVLLAAAA